MFYNIAIFLFKPELGVSPAEFDFMVIAPVKETNDDDDNNYLTSSEMYRVSSQF